MALLGRKDKTPLGIYIQLLLHFQGQATLILPVSEK